MSVGILTLLFSNGISFFTPFLSSGVLSDGFFGLPQQESKNEERKTKDERLRVLKVSAFLKRAGTYTMFISIL